MTPWNRFCYERRTRLEEIDPPPRLLALPRRPRVSRAEYVCHYRHSRSFRLRHRRFSDGAWQSPRPDPASRTGHNRWSGDRNLLIANPLHILKQIGGGIGGVFGGSKYTKQAYIDSLKTMYELLNKARKDGLMALENDVEEPDRSPILSKGPVVLKTHHIRDFVCDSLRMAITGVDAFDLDQMLDLDLEVHHHQAGLPTAALSSMADSLPGLGIVAAVLGIVITMGALGGPPEEIGNKVAAALVGTFLGILLCYGLVGPIAANMVKVSDDEHAYLYVLRVLMVSFLKGTAPFMAVEVARRAIPGCVRPSFAEVEAACRNRAADSPPPEANAASA
jgi:chemotaxis protein MotA